MVRSTTSRVAAVLALAASVVFSLASVPDDAREAPALPNRILVFSKTAGFRHESIPDGIAAIREIGVAPFKGKTPAFEVDATEDSAAFTDANLAKYAAVVFLSTTGNVLDDAQQAAFERFIRSGRGYAGVHAASDTEYEWPWYAKLVGAYFKGHPDIQKATVVVEDRTHPSTSMLPERWERTDEWYHFRDNPRARVRVLARLDESTYNPGPGAMGDHPIAWFHEYDGGRAWYTAGGHTKESFKEELFREHLRGGILWAMGLSPTAPATTSSQPAANPTPEKPTAPEPKAQKPKAQKP